MRKFAWLTAFAVAALFFGAPDSAFAHAGHNHVQQAQAAAPQHAAVTEQTQQTGEFVSVAEPQTKKCPHGQQADCASCCACAGGASVALLMPEAMNRTTNARSEVVAAAVSYYIRQTILDLSRPPKSFV
jgi:hypothetical protein